MAKFADRASGSPDIQLLNEEELAKLLGCSRAKLQRDRFIGVGIPYIKGHGVRGSIRYDVKEVTSWIEKRKRTSTSQED